MKKFIFKFFVFLLMIVFIDRLFVVFKFPEKNLFSHIAKEKMKMVKKTFFKNVKDVDLLIIGSSHAQFAISPNVLKKKDICYNLAYGGGTNIGLQHKLLLDILKYKAQPKTIIYGLDVFSLNKVPKKKDEYQSILFGYDFSTKNYFMYSNFYKFAQFIPKYLSLVANKQFTLPMFISKQKTFDLSMFSDYKGYKITNLGWVQGFGELDTAYIRYDKTQFNPNKGAAKELKDIIQICEGRDIELIIIQIPEHKSALKYYKKYNKFNTWIVDFCEKQNVKYINFNSTQLFPVSSDSLFFDSDHLNYSGAMVFSKILADTLKLKEL